MTPALPVSDAAGAGDGAGSNLHRLVAQAQTFDGAVDESPDPDDAPLYEARKAIYPQSVRGTFRRIKWAVLFVTLGIYYSLPFVRWDRGPYAPSQAVLIDFPNRRFYFFSIEIWPQEVYYLTGLLILAAMMLFLMNAVAGRIWCGYLCPQTVWTDLFQTVERWFEGDRREHLQRNAESWSFDRALRLVGKHFVWLMIAWWTGGAWVLYFADSHTLVRDLAFGHAPLIAYIWIGILTFTTYVLAGHMREQVCLYMCPWPRIQAALTDEWALNVTYRYERGEPRGSFKKNEALRASGIPAGDCVDCLQCVHVCPTGVDIRQGANLGCIQCGLCIDACDAVMAKVGRPTKLIAYDTDINIQRRTEGKAPIYKIVRSRTLLYVGLIVLVCAIMLYTLVMRHHESVTVVHDRNPIFVRLGDGRLRNAYSVQVLNKALEPRSFELVIEGGQELHLDVIGDTTSAAGHPVVWVGPDQTREVRVLVTSKVAPKDGVERLTFKIVDVHSGASASAVDYFRGPKL